jgi:hypothetical protein
LPASGTTSSSKVFRGCSYIYVPTSKVIYHLSFNGTPFSVRSPLTIEGEGEGWRRLQQQATRRKEEYKVHITTNPSSVNLTATRGSIRLVLRKGKREEERDRERENVDYLF